MISEKMLSYIDKYLANQASEAETAIVEEWYQSFETNPGLLEQLNDQEKERCLSSGFSALKAALGTK